MEGITHPSIDDVKITVENQILSKQTCNQYRSIYNLVLHRSVQKNRRYDKFHVSANVFYVCILI